MKDYLTAEVLINRPIPSLGLSKDFMERSRLMGYKSIYQIILMEPKEIIAQKAFTYEWLSELTEFMSKQGVLHLLQPLSENRSY